MYKASVYNSNAGVIELTGHEDLYQVISITGLNPPAAQINAVDPAGIDGTIYNSSRILPRNVVIMLRINGDVEANRLNLYRYFQPGEDVRFYFENKNRNVQIDGTIDTVECGLFTMSEVMQVSIVCPDPYFLAAEDTEATWSGNVFTFTNDSDTEAGFLLQFRFGSGMQADRVLLTKIDAGENLVLIGSFLPGDEFTIDTREGSESVWLVRGGLRLNALEYMNRGSVFSRIDAGKTQQFRLRIISGSVTTLTPETMTASFRKSFRGV